MWEWIPLTKNSIRGRKPVKLYIDLDISLKQYCVLVKPLLVNIIDDDIKMFD